MKPKKHPKLPSWWQVANRRRHLLNGRDSGGIISRAERRELAAINRCLDAVMNIYMPLPTAELRAFKRSAAVLANGKR